MDGKFMPHEQTQSTLVALVAACESMQWAVAWTTKAADAEIGLGRATLLDAIYYTPL